MQRIAQTTRDFVISLSFGQPYTKQRNFFRDWTHMIKSTFFMIGRAQKNYRLRIIKNYCLSGSVL